MLDSNCRIHVQLVDYKCLQRAKRGPMVFYQHIFSKRTWWMGYYFVGILVSQSCGDLVGPGELEPLGQLPLTTSSLLNLFSLKIIIIFCIHQEVQKLGNTTVTCFILFSSEKRCLNVGPGSYSFVFFNAQVRSKPIIIAQNVPLHPKLLNICFLQILGKESWWLSSEILFEGPLSNSCWLRGQRVF